MLNYILLAAVFSITIFLSVSGCSTMQTYNYSPMRAAEQVMTEFSFVLTWTQYGIEGTDKQDLADLALAHYYAGQVAFASGDSAKADEHFNTTAKMLNQIIEEITSEIVPAEKKGQGL